MMQATLLNHSVERSPPMPLTVDNKLPGCLLRFGKTAEEEVSFICHVDTCAAMSTGNLGLHQWLITKYPALVAEYIQYDDASPFEPIRLAVALKDLDGCEITKNKLTAIVRYWTPYLDTDGNRLVISFGLGESIAVNSIVGLPFLSHWKASICFQSNSLTSALLKMKFPLIYEATKVGIPEGTVFTKEDFIRPNNTKPTSIHVTNIGDNQSIGITDSSRHESNVIVKSTTDTRRVHFRTDS